jgi:integrase
VKHVAYGYTLMVNGTREKRFSSAWLTETDALAALTERLRAIEAGQLDRPAERTLGALVEEYLSYKRDKRSLKDDERILRRALLPVLGASTPVRAIRGPAIAQYEKTRMASVANGRGRPVSAYTVSNELSVLRHLLRLAKRWGYLSEAPEITLPKKPEGRRRYLDEAEIAKLLAACASSRNPHLRPLVILAIHTATRQNELLSLTWDQVDLASARIVLARTKNGTPRGVPMNAATYATLVDLQPDAARRTGRLFPPHRGAGLRGSQIREAWEQARARAQLPDVRWHDLRHTGASHLVQRGASLQEVKELLGHSDLRMTLRYAHLSPTHLRAAVDRLDGLTGPVAAVPMAHGLAHSAPQLPTHEGNLA